MIAFLGFNQFFAKWLSPVAFLVVFIFFIFLKQPITKLKINILEYLVSFMIISISTVYILAGFFPDLIGRISQTQYPYKEICKQIYRLKSASLRSSPLTLITQNNEVLKANLKLACKGSDVFFIEEVKNTMPEKFTNDNSVIIFTNEEKRNNFIKRMNKKSQSIPKDLTTLKTKYINSEKQFYKVYLLL